MSFSLLPPEELRREPPLIDWIIKHLVARGALTLMAGEGGLGKSALALALASVVSAGKELFYAGFTVVASGPVVYVDSENPRGEIHRRAAGMEIYEHIYQHDGDLLFEMDRLDEIVQTTDAELVVLDSFRSIFPTVEEKDDKQVLPALRSVQTLARKRECGILLLHHTAKAGGYRGSTEFQNRPDFLCTLRRDRRQGHRFLDWNKVRMGSEPERKYLVMHAENGSVGWSSAYPEQPAGDTWDD